MSEAKTSAAESSRAVVLTAASLIAAIMIERLVGHLGELSDGQVRRWSLCFALAFAIVCLGLASGVVCSSGGGGSSGSSGSDPVFPQTQIPAQSDWTEMGDVILPGLPGSWDARLDGSITPCTVVKKDGTYFLYYVGADGDRSSGGGPRNRTLGVATSSNGIDFTKYAGNPVIELPRSNVNPEEEGAFNCGGTLDDGENVVMYWEQNVGTGDSNVSAHVQLAISPDGFTFTDLGPVFDHRDATWRAGGDEVGPAGAFERDGTWYVFIIVDGRWELGIAWGPSMDSLVNTAPLLTGSGADVRGGGDPVFIGPDTIALFLSRGSGAREIDVRTTSPDTPDSISAPVETYNFGDVSHATVFLDREIGQWFLYYQIPTGDRRYRVRTAQMVPVLE